MVAAILHLDEGADAVGYAVHEGDASPSPKRCHRRGFSPNVRRRSPAARDSWAIELFLVAEHKVDLGHVGEVCGSVCAAQPETMMRRPDSRGAPCGSTAAPAARLRR